MHQDFFFNNDFFIRAKGIAPGLSLSDVRWSGIWNAATALSNALFVCSTRSNMVVYFAEIVRS